MIIDFSTARPSISVLKAAGVTAAGRYLGWDCEPGYGCIHKNLTKPEAQAYLAANISIFLAFEYLADAPARGAPQGHADGQLAWTQLARLSAPPTMGVYFASDWDVPDYAPSLPDTPASALAKLGPVGQYFTAIRALGYPYKIGGYGDYYVVKRLLDAKLIDLAWQTRGWSGTPPLIEKRAVLYQNAAPAPIPGTDIDVRQNAATTADFGQWPRPSIPGPPPVSKESKMLAIVYPATSEVPAGRSWPGEGLSDGKSWVHITTPAALAVYESAGLPRFEITWGQFTRLINA